ncbi:MAG: lytic transglycosylase domain-containing protein [Spirochaetes bacterium]|nr:lytic transglycosylase domain-containing protein [Spirochaetota bacterium]
MKNLALSLLLIGPFALQAQQGPARSEVEELLVLGKIPAEGVEDAVAWLKLTKSLGSSNRTEQSNASSPPKAALDAFAASFPDSPYLTRLGMLRAVALYESRPFSEVLTNRMSRSDAQAFFVWLKNKQRWSEAAEFLEDRILAAEKPSEWTPLAGDLAYLWKKAGGDFTKSVLEGTNAQERYTWGKFFYKADRYPEAVGFLESVAPTNELTTHRAPEAFEEAHYYLGVCEAKRLHYTLANGHFRRFLAAFPESSPDKESPRAWARFHFIENLERLSKWEEAWTETTNAWTRAPEERYLRLAVRMAKALGREDYPKWRKLYLDAYPNSWSAYLSSRDDALTLLIQGKREEGLALLSKVYRARGAELGMLGSILSNTNQALLFLSNDQAAFDYFYFNEKYAKDSQPPYGERLSFLSNEKMKILGASNAVPDFPKAGRGYLVAAEDPKWRALAARKHPFAAWTNTPPKIPPQVERRVKILLALGEQAFAEQALRRHPFATELEKNAALRAFFALSGDEDRYVKNDLLPLDSRREEWNYFPYEILRRAFPRWHEELVLYFARLYKVPPHLAWAVMREESHFNPDAVSGAGAVGLMQIMDATGRGLYAGAALAKLQRYDLKDPVLSVHLGIRYLAYLLRFFQGDEVKAVAGYNAGEYNVARWAKNNGPFHGSLHFALMIPYDETERYVVKVLRSKWFYDILYGLE